MDFLVQALLLPANQKLLVALHEKAFIKGVSSSFKLSRDLGHKCIPALNQLIASNHNESQVWRYETPSGRIPWWPDKWRRREKVRQEALGRVGVQWREPLRLDPAHFRTRSRILPGGGIRFGVVFHLHKTLASKLISYSVLRYGRHRVSLPAQSTLAGRSGRRSDSRILQAAQVIWQEPWKQTNGESAGDRR
ncbi:hypothetical protein M405DRAFT_836510 [Rhizopogon salebrosus TDB-379]|nr:hypothetical protein M405DRAFT_836510 [Rhizopogon salebrosus TDB-379]